MGNCNDHWCEHYNTNSHGCDNCSKLETEMEKPELNAILKRRAIEQMELSNTNTEPCQVANMSPKARGADR